MWAGRWEAELGVAELVFALMPLRHSPTVPRLERVLGHIDAREQQAEQLSELLLRFRRQTTRRLQDALATARQTAPGGDAQHQAGEGDEEGLEDILEREEMAVEAGSDLETSMVKEKLYRAVLSFAQDRLPPPPASTDGKEPEGRVGVAVSLSGGVDSMVLAFILAHAVNTTSSAASDPSSRQRGRRPPPPRMDAVVAMHINYGNRGEADAEAAYVRQWCERHRILYTERRMAEAGLQRGVTARDEYEKKTREARYDLYKETIGGGSADPAVAGVHCPGVCVGHHVGDLQENVISNMMKGGTLLDLGGMGESSVVNGVSIWRPLLPFTKEQIYEFAHRYGVPYFKDTTPHWSTRGHLRNELVPLLSSTYLPLKLAQTQLETQVCATCNLCNRSTSNR